MKLSVFTIQEARLLPTSVAKIMKYYCWIICLLSMLQWSVFAVNCLCNSKNPFKLQIFRILYIYTFGHKNKKVDGCKYKDVIWKYTIQTAKYIFPLGYIFYCHTYSTRKRNPLKANTLTELLHLVQMLSKNI